MILLEFFGCLAALGALYYVVVYFNELNKIKNDSRYKYLNTSDDEIIFNCKDCTCTKYYLIIKTGIKRTFCYEDIIWIYPYFHRYMANKEQGLILKAYTKKGKGYRVIYGTDEEQRTFDKVMSIIQEKNPNCLFGDTEENNQKFRSMI